MYYEMPVIQTAKITGVQLKFISRICRQDRTTFIGTANAFGDFQAEVRLVEEIEGFGEGGREKTQVEPLVPVLRGRGANNAGKNMTMMGRGDKYGHTERRGEQKDKAQPIILQVTRTGGK